MKIVHFVHSYPPETYGGVEFYLQALSRELTDRRHQNYIISGSRKADKIIEDTPTAKIYRIGLTQHELLPEFTTYNPIVESHIRKYLQEIKPDLAHLHHWHHLTDNIVEICHQLEIPVVITLHDLWVTCPNINRTDQNGNFCDESKSAEDCIGGKIDLNGWREQVKIELALAQHIITPSKALIDFIGKCVDIPPQTETTVLPHGIWQPINPIKNDREKFPKTSLKIGYWGALVPIKGVRNLLQAFGDLYSEGYKNMELHIMH